MTDQERIAALDKRVIDMASRIVWAKTQTYNLQNNLLERMGTTLFDLFNVADDIDAILRYLNPSKDGQP